MDSWFSIVQKFSVSILYFPYQLLIIQTQSIKNFTFSLFFCGWNNTMLLNEETNPKCRLSTAEI
jgi:hypothetical protein